MKIGNKILNNEILPKHAYVGSISVFTCEHLQKKFTLFLVLKNKGISRKYVTKMYQKVLEHYWAVSRPVLTTYGVLVIRKNVSSFNGNGETLGANGPRPIWYKMTTSGGTL